MIIRDIAEVLPRLQQSVAALPGDPLDATDLFERTEQVAIQILDSEHDWYPDGQLQGLLMQYLKIRQIELGLLPFPDPGEE